MGMSKTTVSFFLPIFFATIVICAIVLCTCAYCYKPSYFLGIRRTADFDYDDDPEKAPRGRVVVVSTVSFFFFFLPLGYIAVVTTCVIALQTTKT